MGTALVMEHANALAQMIVSEKDKLFDERVEALVKLYRRAEFYLKYDRASDDPGDDILWSTAYRSFSFRI